MLASLKLILDIPENMEFNYNKTSLLHGVIMEIIDVEYAEKLHQNHLNPYSMFLSKKGNNYIWTVCTINQEAYHNIICKLIQPDFGGFTLKHNDVYIKISGKLLETEDKSNLMNEFYQKESDNLMTINFVTPTAFKRQGEYIFYPDVELMFRNIMNKYSASSDDETFQDDETLEQIVNNTKIIRYNLRSVPFSLEGVRIPAFMGKITIRINGTKAIQNFVRLLLEFSEYSGIGIKCSLGMGAVQFEKEERNGR